MFSQPQVVQFTIPEWVIEYAGTYKQTSDLAKRMCFVIEAAKRNIEAGTGGPFAAAIFETATGRLVSLGINLVTTENLSILHAEVVAITLAQRKLGSYDLGLARLPEHELVASTEPCAMCFGAIPWSGVRHVATAASSLDAGEIGFDEGSKPDNWVSELEARNIRVSSNIQGESAREVLKYYSDLGNHIYNSRDS